VIGKAISRVEASRRRRMTPWTPEAD